MSEKPIAIIADVHFNDWKSFSEKNLDGVNSRLKITMDEIDRVVKELNNAGGKDIIIAGDLFHVRGSIDPEVFNPVRDCFAKHCANGNRFITIPGNHDLKSRETTELGNSFQTLNSIKGFEVNTKPCLYTLGTRNIFLIPWVSTKEALLKEISDAADIYSSVIGQIELVIHYGIDDVFSNMPEHGLTAKELAAFGFKRVFAGHYHHHKKFDGEVYSIGSLNHQKWGDIGSKSGFLITTEDEVKYVASNAPSFIEITTREEIDDIPFIVANNYIRISNIDLSEKEIIEVKELCLSSGALAVLFQITKKEGSIRSSSSASIDSIGESIDKFVEDNYPGDDCETLKQMCKEIILNSKVVSE